MQRPPRPFGVTLAILASLILFTVFPLMQLVLLMLVRLHFSRITFDDNQLQPFAMGTDVLGISDSRLMLQAIVALSFLIIAYFAWKGRPPVMRFVLMAACIALTCYSVLSAVISQISQLPQSFGASSLDSVLNSLALGQFGLGILVTLYVIWYLNRGPARAFYRGYYLPLPENASLSMPNQ